jgi:hypothetical protein
VVVATSNVGLDGDLVSCAFKSSRRFATYPNGTQTARIFCCVPRAVPRERNHSHDSIALPVTLFYLGENAAGIFRLLNGCLVETIIGYDSRKGLTQVNPRRTE